MSKVKDVVLPPLSKLCEALEPSTISPAQLLTSGLNQELSWLRNQNSVTALRQQNEEIERKVNALQGTTQDFRENRSLVTTNLKNYKDEMEALSLEEIHQSSHSYEAEIEAEKVL
jgi:hypothetical protein